MAARLRAMGRWPTVAIVKTTPVMPPAVSAAAIMLVTVPLRLHEII